MFDARNITHALKGRWYRHYGVAFCPAHSNTRTPALRLRDGRDGRLLAICGAGCSFADVATALRGLGLIQGFSAKFAPDARAEEQQREEEKFERHRRIAQARSVWAKAGPIGGTLAERYLRARDISGSLPPSLRYCGSVWHGTAARCLPAMVAAVNLVGETELVAVHRTYLTEPGRKADVAPRKAMLGPVAGGAVRLSVGIGPLVVCEGIETGLSLVDAFAFLSPGVWAALSTSGVAGLILPSPAGELVIAPDGDTPGLKAAESLAHQAFAKGWQVRILPAPGDGCDWNDAGREAAG